MDFLDNFHVLDLLENKDNGILTLVDESTRNNTDDIQLLTIFQQLYMDNENIEFSELDKEMFMLRHTANDIDYLIEGFS